LNNVPNKKQRTILTVASKHFSHVTFYAADVESSLIRSNVAESFYNSY